MNIQQKRGWKCIFIKRQGGNEYPAQERMEMNIQNKKRLETKILGNNIQILV